MGDPKLKNCVAIIGGESFDAGKLYSLIMIGAVDELVFLGGDSSETISNLEELLAQIPLEKDVRLSQSGFGIADRAAVAVLANGAKRRPNESVYELLRRNNEIVRKEARKLIENNFRGVILVVITPVDLLANAILQETGLPNNKVIGSGFTFEQMMSQEDLQNSDDDLLYSRQLSLFNEESGATWCAAKICGSTMIDNCRPDCSEFDSMLLVDKEQSAGEFDETDQNINFAGSCIPKICEAVIGDEKVILPVAAMTSGQYGISGTYLNLPCVIGKKGVEDILEIDVDSTGRQMLLETANKQKEFFQTYLTRRSGTDQKLTEKR